MTKIPKLGRLGKTFPLFPTDARAHTCRDYRETVPAPSQLLFAAALTGPKKPPTRNLPRTRVMRYLDLTSDASRRSDETPSAALLLTLTHSDARISPEIRRSNRESALHLISFERTKNPVKNVPPSAPKKRRLSHLSTAKIVRELILGPSTVDELVEVSGLSPCTVSLYLRTLKQEGAAHVVAWERDSMGRDRTPVYALGAGRDKPRKTKTAAEKSREQRARRQAAPQWRPLINRDTSIEACIQPRHCAIAGSDDPTIIPAVSRAVAARISTEGGCHG